MNTGFVAFMEKLIDYAGLFPPANLSLEKAFPKYCDYLKHPDSWMLSRFICPASRLGELAVYRGRLLTEQQPVSFSVLGSGGNTPDEFYETLQVDLQKIELFRREHGSAVITDSFEVRIPISLAADTGSKNFSAFLKNISEIFGENGPPEITLFYESALTGHWQQKLENLAGAIADHNANIKNKTSRRYKSAGFKLRCGGVEPSMYPSTGQVAFAIHTCKEAKVAMKATAGLHHPFRHFNREAGVKMHGFINVFGAGMLAHSLDLNKKQIHEIVVDEEVGDFKFNDDGFSWQEMRCSEEAIRELRKKYLISFGSCSFDEPREDLKALGIY